MPLCTKHGLFYTDSQTCGQCWREDQVVKKSERKELNRFSKFSKPTTQKGIDRKKLKDKLQAAWSGYMKHIKKWE